MPDDAFGAAFVHGLIARCLSRVEFVERTDDAGGPHLPLSNIEDPAADAGYLRLWSADDDSHLDRMVHFRLRSDPVDTQLFFLFGRADTVMPHFSCPGCAVLTRCLRL